VDVSIFAIQVGRVAPFARNYSSRSVMFYAISRQPPRNSTRNSVRSVSDVPRAAGGGPRHNTII
jgi:hypothetical protein